MAIESLVVPVVGLGMGGALLTSAFVKVRPVERAVVERLGKYQRFLEPGWTFIIPLVDKVQRINITEQMTTAEKQEIITKDNLNAFVDAIIFFKVKKDEESVKKALYNVGDVESQLVALARTTLRNVVGTKDFREVNSERNKLNEAVQEIMRKETETWGVEIVRCELKEIEPPKDVQETMNKVIKAQNEKQAAVDLATAKETEADGIKRSEIKKAEGNKQADILKAEGQATAIKKVAEAEAERIKLVNESAQKYFVENAQKLRQLDVVESSLKENSKIILTSEGISPVLILNDGEKTVIPLQGGKNDDNKKQKL